MFTAEDIRARIRRRPFIPMRITMSSGEVYEVTHPELIFVGRRWIAVGTPSRTDPTLPETLYQLPILHIAGMDNLPMDALAGESPEPGPGEPAPTGS